MYKLDINKDGSLPLVFLDALTFIPALYEGCSYIDEAKRETFVMRFNKHYSAVAEKKVHDGHEILAVCALYDEKKMGEDPEPPQIVTKTEAKEIVAALVAQWKDLFGLTNADIKKYWYEYRNKRLIIK